MSAKVIPITSPVEERWQAFVEALERAQRTKRFEDGDAAAKALRRFYDLYLTEDQRRQIDRRPT